MVNLHLRRRSKIVNQEANIYLFWIEGHAKSIDNEFDVVELQSVLKLWAQIKNLQTKMGGIMLRFLPFQQ